MKMIRIIAVILFWAAGAFAQDTVVQTFSGSGRRNTRSFAVKDNWEIRWHTNGEVFDLYLMGIGGDKMRDVTGGTREEIAYVHNGGQYYLIVNASGNWVIEIIQIGMLLKNASTQDTVIQTFSGSGGRNTRPFTVKDNWEIQWDTRGDLFQLFLYRVNGESEGIPANQQGTGKGASYEPKGGQYYLKVNATTGNWTIKIVQILTKDN
jgi:hypothetical protein